MLARRTLLKTAASGFGYLAFAGLVHLGGREASRRPARPKAPHFPARAKRVIFLCMEGGPSHVDTFDYKPKLDRRRRQAVRPGRGVAAPSCSARRGSSASTARAGCGSRSCSPSWPSMPTTCACVQRHAHRRARTTRRRSCRCTRGIFQFTRPSLGAWTLYGLGTENENLPGFVTISPPLEQRRAGELRQRFLPAVYQGTPIGSRPVRPDRPAAPTRSATSRNPRHRPPPSGCSSTSSSRSTATPLERDQVNPGIEGVIESFELAFRMQEDLPEADGPVERNGGDAGRSTASANRRPTTSAGSACWPGGSSRPASASSRSATAAGTSTAT